MSGIRAQMLEWGIFIALAVVILAVTINDVETLDKGKLNRPTYSKIPQPKTDSSEIETETHKYKLGQSLFENVPPSVKVDHRWPSDETYNKNMQFLDSAGLRTTERFGTQFPKYKREIIDGVPTFKKADTFESYPDVLDDPRYDPSGGFEMAKRYYYLDENKLPQYSTAPIKDEKSTARWPAPWQAGQQTAMSALVEPINDYTNYSRPPPASCEVLDAGGKTMTPMPRVDIELDPMLKNLPANHPAKLAMIHNDAARIKHKVYGRDALRDGLVKDILSFRQPSRWGRG